MTQDKLLKKVAKIVGAETKQMVNGKFMTKFKDSDGDSYTLFHTKSDGTDSKAFQAFKTFPMSWINSFVEVLYKEEEFSKDGKTYLSRKIAWLKLEWAPKEDIPQMSLGETSAVTGSTEPITYTTTETKQDEIKVSNIPF